MLEHAAAGFERIGAAALFLVGLLMVTLGATAEADEPVAVALVGFGSALMPLAVLLPRLVGPLKVSASGLEAQLAAVVKAEAEAEGIRPEVTERAVQLALPGSGQDLRDRARELLSDAEILEVGSEMVEIGLESLGDSMRDPRLKDLLDQVRTYRTGTESHDD